MSGVKPVMSRQVSPAARVGVGEVVDAGGAEGGLDVGVGAERADLGAQDEVVAHAGGG